MQLQYLILLLAPLGAHLTMAGPLEPGARLEMRDDNFCNAEIEYPDKRDVPGVVTGRDEHLNTFGKRSDLGTCNWQEGNHNRGIYGLCYKLEKEGESGACRKMENPAPCPCRVDSPCPRSDAVPRGARVAVLNQGSTNRNQFRPLCLYQDPTYAVDGCVCNPYPPDTEPSPPASPQDKRSWVRKIRAAVTSKFSRA